ncbi:MAG: NAD(P)H-binding protein [Candidatus Eisenbacteria bacterium]|uniref:NAD(P)H-binding protein n=1 Tax=Eiseniibacteriota bacterium TaxID=2212470 RepID=A0A849SL94_UNCEI|nr:NAD(P)H-binding protein [Candidatus Eisenbacteria bacterium]
MKILVTGASGFIGQPLVRRLLVSGHAVRALVRRVPVAAPGDTRAGGAEYLQGDLSDVPSLARAVAGMDAIVHLACATGVADAALVQRINVDGTRALLEAAKTAGVRRFVFVSTISATRERMGPYGRTKLEGERLVAASGLEWVTVRPSLVYGSSDIGLFATLSAYLKKLPVVPVIGDGKIELDPVHVEDVNAVIEQCVTRADVIGKSYDLLGPERVTFNDFLALVSRSLGVQKPVVHLPGPLALLMASVLGMISKRPPVSVDNVLGMISPARVDREPLRRDFKLPWIRLEEGLRRNDDPRSSAGAAVAANLANAYAAAPPPRVPLSGTSLSPGSGMASPPSMSPSGVELGAVAMQERPTSPGSVPLPEMLRNSPRPLRKVRVGVVGLGKMGVAHTTVLSMIPDCEVVGLVDHHPGLAKSLQGMGHRAPYFKSVDALIDRAAPDAIFVCTPQNSHLAVSRLALEGGCAVFVEKPLAHTLEEGEKLAELAAEKRRPVGCGFTLAYLPVFAAGQHALATGALGAVRQARSSMYLSQVFGPRKGWMYEKSRSGGGVVANISSHLLFLLEWYLGTPVEVRANASRLYGEVEDELHGMMTLASGAEVGFDSSWSVPGYPLSAVVIEIEGENGKLLVSNDALELDLAQAAGGWPAGYSRLRPADLPQPARYDVNGEGYYLEDAAFLAWATGGVAPPTTVDSALRVQRVMDALYRSADQSGERVKVSS